ncbi:MAG: TspO/MBR family protein [Protaetiibacter sp.]
MDTTTRSLRATHPVISILVLLGSVLLATGVGFAGSLATTTHVDGWYADAEKAAWNPPDAVFGPVWTALYLVMAVAAWLVWRRRHEAEVRPALLAYLVQLVLNAAWTPVFFALYPAWRVAALWIAFGIIVALAAAVLVTILRFWPVHSVAAVLLMPYLAWVVFASSLNLAIAVYAS